VSVSRVDPEFVRRLGGGDKDAEREFYAFYGRLVRAMARVRLPYGGALAAEEVVNDTLSRVLMAARQGSIRDPHCLGAFVSATCRNVISEGTRIRRREVPLTESSAGMTTTDPETETMMREQATLVQDVMADLPQRDRETLKGVLMDGADRDEMCRTFNITPGYFRVLLCRAKENVRQRMGEGRGTPLKRKRKV